MTASPNVKNGVILDRGKRVVYKGKSINGRLGSRVFSDSPTYFTHFTGIVAGDTTAPEPWLTYTATGTVTSNSTIAGLGGIYTIYPDNTAAGGVELSTPLAFQPDTNAPLVFETRLRVSSTFATTEVFFGFADALSYTGKPYTVTTGSAITGTNAPDDFAGFAISSVPTGGALFNTAIDGGTTDGTFLGLIQSIDSTDTISAATFNNGLNMGLQAVSTIGAVNDCTSFHVYRVEINKHSGADEARAEFFVDGKYCGKTGLIDATVPLCGYIGVCQTSTGAAAVAIDYIYTGGSSTWAA